MKIQTFNNLETMKKFFGFKYSGEIFETDLHIVENDTDANDRKYHDAEVLTTLAKNLQGNVIEIGTSHGLSTYKLATNTSGTIYTLNALPEQMSGSAITHALKKEDIGKYLRDKDIKNYVQFYDNSLNWKIPDYIKDVSIVFVDGCHDTNFVYLDSMKTYEKLKIGGFIVWHDFNPELITRFSWISSAMNGAFKFCTEKNMTEIYHLKNSWMGFAMKK